MQLKTPKRYRRQKRRVVGSWRGFRNLVLVALLAGAAWWIYNNQDLAQNYLDDTRSELNTQIDGIQTSIPRQPTATRDVTNEIAQASAAYQTGDFRRAIELYEQIAFAEPNNIEAHYRLGLLLLITSDLGADDAQLQRASEIADRAINADPESPDGWAIKGMSLVWAGEYGTSLSYSERALEIDPNFVQAKAFLAEAYWELERLERAEQTITEAVDYLRSAGAAEPNTIALVFRTRGYIAERQLDRETAIDAYTIARQAAPTYGFISLELALSYFGAGQTTEAIELLNLGLDSNPRDVSLLYQLGRIYVNVGDTTEALGIFQRCIDADPDFWQCYSWLGGLQYFSGTYAQAVTNLERSISLGSDDLSDWVQLGLSHSYMLRCDLAIPVLREGYGLAEGNQDRQGQFVSALRECGVQESEIVPQGNAAQQPVLTPTPVVTPTQSP